MNSEVVVEPRQWYLKTTTGGAYYMLMIAHMDSRYFILQRHGKMGSRISVSVGFLGVVIGSKEGYDTIDEAYEEGSRLIERKIHQSGDRQYVLLDENESYVYVKDGVGRVKVMLTKAEIPNLEKRVI